MSVVNDMLRDLDKRQAPERSGDFTGQAVQESMIEPQKIFSLSSILLVVVLCTAILISSVWFFSLREVHLSEAHVAVINTVPIVNSENINSTNPPVNSVDAQIEVIKGGNALAGRAVEHRVDETSEKAKPVATPVVEKKRIEMPIAKQKVINQKVAKQKVAKQSAAKPAVIEPKDIPASRNGSSSLKAKAVDFKPAENQSKMSLATTPKSTANKKFTALRPNQSLRSNEGSLSTKIIQLSPKALDQQSAEQAEALFSQGEARQAYRHLYDFIALHEMDSKSRTVLAGHLLLAKRLAEAGDILVGGKTETHPDLRQIKARWLVAKGEHKLALYTLSSNQPDISEYPAYYELMASYYQRFGYSKKALLTYSQLVQFDGSVANWWAGLAISSDQEKQWESARFAYQQAFELPGLNPKLVEFVKSRLVNLSQN